MRFDDEGGGDEGEREPGRNLYQMLQLLR